MTYEKIHYAVADGIATIELSDPPANTYSYEMMREIDAAVLDARMDAAVHVRVHTRVENRAIELLHHLVGVRVCRWIEQRELRDSA